MFNFFRGFSKLTICASKMQVISSHCFCYASKAKKIILGELDPYISRFSRGVAPLTIEANMGHRSESTKVLNCSLKTWCFSFHWRCFSLPSHYSSRSFVVQLFYVFRLVARITGVSILKGGRAPAKIGKFTIFFFV